MEDDVEELMALAEDATVQQDGAYQLDDENLMYQAQEQAGVEYVPSVDEHIDMLEERVESVEEDEDLRYVQ